MISLSLCAITTTDNPYNPLTDFSNWNAFDQQMGYNLCSLFGRLVNQATDLSNEDEEKAIEEAVDKIVAMNPTGNCIKFVSGDRVREDESD